MTIQKITEKATTCFFCILLPRYNTIFPHLGNMVETLHWHSHSKTTWTKKTCKKNWYEYDTATLGCLAEYGSHGLWSKCLLPTSKTDFKTIPLDIKTCLLHLASVAINKKTWKVGNARRQTQVCLLWLCCILYLIVFAIGLGSFPYWVGKYPRTIVLSPGKTLSEKLDPNVKTL